MKYFPEVADKFDFLTRELLIAKQGEKKLKDLFKWRKKEDIIYELHPVVMGITRSAARNRYSAQLKAAQLKTL